MSELPMHPALSFLLRPSPDDAPRARALCRAAIGFVFLTSGALKFLYANQGVGRFARTGLPPNLAFFVGAVEIACGALVLVGLFARLGALPLVVDMAVAIVTTKLPTSPTTRRRPTRRPGSPTVARCCAIAAPPDELRVTRESREGSAPAGIGVLWWTATGR